MVHLTFLFLSSCKNCGIKTDWSIPGAGVQSIVTFLALLLLGITTRDEVFIIRSFIKGVLCASIWLQSLHHFIIHSLVSSNFPTSAFFILLIREQGNLLIFLQFLSWLDGPSLDSPSELSSSILASNPWAVTTSIQEVASSMPIKAKVAAVFSLDIKFCTHLMDSGEKGHLSIFKDGCG